MSRKIHGETHTRLYNIWANMKARCRNERNPEYKRYGERNIKICEDWLTYSNFRQWAISNGYNEKLSIDRIDNNGDYCPENCRWTTPKEQANNTRKTRFITIGDKTHSVSEWSRILGIKQSTLNMRLNKYGWSEEKALTKEAAKYGT